MSRKLAVLAALDLPAGQLSDDERWTLHNRVEQLVGWAKAGKTHENYLMDYQSVDNLRFEVVRVVEEILTARQSASR